MRIILGHLTLIFTHISGYFAKTWSPSSYCVQTFYQTGFLPVSGLDLGSLQFLVSSSLLTCPSSGWLAEQMRTGTHSD